jgi:hypothetical protein
VQALPHRTAPQVVMPRLGRRRGRNVERRRILVLSFTPDTQHVLESLREFAPPGSHVTLVCE